MVVSNGPIRERMTAVGSDATAATSMAPFGLCLALWPIVVVHLAYAISVADAHVPLCNPYWDGCTSISRAGRHGWANHLFRAALLPYTLGLGFYWWLNQQWLRSLGAGGSRAMLVSGWIGVLFMVLYVTFLGTEGATYQLLRRYGINVYFGATFAAQLLLIGRLRRLAGGGSMPWPRWLVPALMVIAASVLAMGLLYLAAAWGLPLDRDRMENTMEWGAALLMQLTMLLVALAWHRSGLYLQAGSRDT